MWDLFISHASEDKESVVRSLAEALEQHGLAIWFDEQTLRLGDSLRQKIDEGLANCRFGVVVISHAFLSKEWPQRELDALLSREDSGAKRVLPVWHGITVEDLRAKSPILSSRLAISTSRGLDAVVQAILDAMGIKAKKPDMVKVLRFSSSLRADEVSVKVAVNAFKKGNRIFQIDWPSDTLQYLHQLRTFLSEAEGYTSSKSSFFGTSQDIIANFIDSAEIAIAQAEPIVSHAALRIGLLLQGMDSYWENLTNCHERALKNFLTLANATILYSVLYPFRYEVLYERFFPCEFEPWFNKRWVENCAELFDIDEPIWQAYTKRISGEEFRGYYWGPKSLIEEAYTRFSPDRAITNPWFVHYLIPQVELTLARTKSHQQMDYDERALITKVLNEQQKEL